MTRVTSGEGDNVYRVVIMEPYIGTLNIGDPFICGDFPGKVRSITNEHGNRLKKAGPSDAIQIQGLESVPQAGDLFAVVENEKEIKKILSSKFKTYIPNTINLSLLSKLSSIWRISSLITFILFLNLVSSFFAKTKSFSITITSFGFLSSI
mgnify:CR=1 FL=1